jgi:hypothetical protein
MDVNMTIFLSMLYHVRIPGGRDVAVWKSSIIRPEPDFISASRAVATAEPP